MLYLTAAGRLLLKSEVLISGAVGVYVPGGTAVLPSSALMLCVPAGLAGCSTIVLATPPRPDGSITPVWTRCPTMPPAYLATYGYVPSLY